MGLKEDKTITDIVQAVRESDAKKTKGYDTQATVIRVEDGKAWVHIPGGVPETPVELTINAQPGDIVMVRLAGGRAFLLGNATSPPTDDATAKEALSNAADALQSAVSAKLAADSAEASAATASAAAQDAVETAEAVHGIAEQAQADAETAKTNAQTAITNAAAAQAAAGAAQTSADNAQAQAASATASANGALNGLSTVQDVIGVLDWAKDNATYTLTSDPDIVPGKTYWTRSGSGTSADPYVYTPVVTPVKADLGTYYEISGVDEAMADYINTHLALTDEGLYVLGGANQWKVLIAPDGVYIIDGTSGVDKVVAKYKDAITLGIDDGTASYLAIDSDSVDFYEVGGDKVATIGRESTFGKFDTGQGRVTLGTDGMLLEYSFELRPLSWNQAGEFGIIRDGQGSQVTYRYLITLNKDISLTIPEDPVAGTEIQLTISSTAFTDHVYFTAGTQSSQQSRGGTFTYDGGTNITFTYTGMYYPTPSLSGMSIYVETTDGGYLTVGSRLGTEPRCGRTATVGEFLVALYVNQLICGKYNNNQSNNAFEIGNGTSNTDRSNAFSVDWGGETRVCINEYTTTGNVDKTIYDALSSLGWLSDCVES